MKTALLLSLVTFSLMSGAQAKALFGTVDRYIIVKTGQVVEIGSNEIEDGVASFYDYSSSSRKTIEVSELSKSTREEIAGVKAGEAILANTYLGNSKTETVSRYCLVFEVFANKQAHVGCQTVAADGIPGYALPSRFDFIINNVENVTAEVQELDGFKKSGNYELRINTQVAKAGKNVRILAMFANGEALVQKSGLSVLDTGSILTKNGYISRIKLSDLNN